MPVVPKPVLLLRLFVETPNNSFSNVLYYEPPTGITTVSQVQAIANAAFNTFKTLYAACLNNQNNFAAVTAEYNSGTLQLEASSTAAAETGTGAVSPLPDQTAVVLRKVTNIPGRSNQGRWFVSGLDSLIVNTASPDDLDPGHYSEFQALVAAMVSDQTWDSLLFHARLWNRKSGALVPIALGEISTRFATQRARRKRAPNFAR